jgi:ATP-dependent DNA ligase
MGRLQNPSNQAGSRVDLFSRRGASYTEKFKSVAKAVAGIHADAAILDWNNCVLELANSKSAR